MLFAGIDGGQSGTTAAIGDGERVLARGRSGPADEIAAGTDSTRLRDALEGALADALSGANLPQDTRFDAIVAGVSGYEGRIYGAPPRMPTNHFVLMHDAPIAHAGALGGEPGVVVIAGTGSVAYTVAKDGRTKTTGGLGYVFGDEGSAFWIVRTVVSVAERDERRAQPLLHYFGVSSVRELMRAFYSGEITRARLASYAPIVLENDREVARRAATMLCALAREAKLDDRLTVAFTGGLMQHPSFKARVYKQMRGAKPKAKIVEPVTDPAEGALMLARRT
jgi:glucosamine kinase